MRPVLSSGLISRALARSSRASGNRRCSRRSDASRSRGHPSSRGRKSSSSPASQDAQALWKALSEASRSLSDPVSVREREGRPSFQALAAALRPRHEGDGVLGELGPFDRLGRRVGRGALGLEGQTLDHRPCLVVLGVLDPLAPRLRPWATGGGARSSPRRAAGRVRSAPRASGGPGPDRRSAPHGDRSGRRRPESGGRPPLPGSPAREAAPRPATIGRRRETCRAPRGAAPWARSSLPLPGGPAPSASPFPDCG